MFILALALLSLLEFSVISLFVFSSDDGVIVEVIPKIDQGLYVISCTVTAPR